MFTFYVEPIATVGDETSETRQLYTGLGSDGDGERAVVGVFEDGAQAAIELTHDELEEVVVDLVRVLAAMDSQR